MSKGADRSRPAPFRTPAPLTGTGAFSPDLGVALRIREPLHGPGLEVVLDLLAVHIQLDRARVTEDEVDLVAVLEGLGLALLEQSVEQQPAVVVLGGDPALAVGGADLDGHLVLGRGRDGAVRGIRLRP